jgi:hypothetical protein
MIERNVFSLGRRTGDEDQLTEYLAWLIEVLPSVGGTVIDLALGRASDAATQEISVATQHRFPGRRLDAMIETDAVRLVIESKLNSGYGEGQLEDYLRWLAENRKSGQQQVLMTVTIEPKPWPSTAQQLAAELGVLAQPTRWENLHEAFLALLEEDRLSGLDAQLVGEFCDLLAQEGFVPMRPLNAAELGPLWQESREAIDRFHAYYRACETPIAAALGVTAVGRGSFKPEQAYRTFWFDELGTGLAVGIYASGADWKLSGANQLRKVPVLMAACWGNAWEDAVDFAAMADHLDANAPAGWTRTERFYKCPCVLRYLDGAVGHGTFDQQQANLANAFVPLRAWVESAFAAVPPKRRRRFGHSQT